MDVHSLDPLREIQWHRRTVTILAASSRESNLHLSRSSEQGRAQRAPRFHSWLHDSPQTMR
jgi:hypothetical protein